MLYPSSQKWWFFMSPSQIVSFKNFGVLILLTFLTLSRPAIAHLRNFFTWNITMTMVYIVSLLATTLNQFHTRRCFFDQKKNKINISPANKSNFFLKKKGIWDLINLSKVPTSCQLLCYTWVYKKKRNGIYYLRLVVMVSPQIPGVGFTNFFAPVVDDITIHILLILMMIYRLESTMLENEQVFYMASSIEKFLCIFLKKWMMVVTNEFDLNIPFMAYVKRHNLGSKNSLDF